MGAEGARSARRHQLPTSQQGNSSPEFSRQPTWLHHLFRRDLSGLAKLERPEKSGTLPWRGDERWKDVDQCTFFKTTVTTPGKVLQE